MYEHPYLTYRVVEFEQQHAALLAERGRRAQEDGMRVRPRAGLIERMLRSIRPQGPASARRAASATRSVAAPARAATEDCPAGRDCAALAA